MNVSNCPKCQSEQLVPKYVKRNQLEQFKRGESVDYVGRVQGAVVRVIICDDCKAIVNIPGEPTPT